MELGECPFQPGGKGLEPSAAIQHALLLKASLIEDEYLPGVDEPGQSRSGLLPRQAASRGQGAGLDRLPGGQGLEDDLLRRASFQTFQTLQQWRVKATMALGPRLDDLSTRQGPAGVSKDERVALQDRRPPLGLDLPPPDCARLQLLGIQEADPRGGLKRTGMKCNGGVVFQDRRDVPDHLKPSVHGVACGKRLRRSHHGPTLQLLLANTGKIDGEPSARPRGVELPPVTLESAYPRPEPLGGDLDLLSHLEAAIDESAGDHDAEPRHNEYPVYRQARRSHVLPDRGLLQQPHQELLEVVETLPGHR